MAPRTLPGRVLYAAWAVSAVLAGCAGPPSETTRPAEQAPSAAPTLEAMIPAYRARPSRARAVIAVVGENSGVEVSDFLVYFAILSRAGTLDVSAVTFHIHRSRADRVRIATETTVAQLDAIHPEEADYIIAPAQASTPRLIAWLTRQSGQGGDDRTPARHRRGATAGRVRQAFGRAVAIQCAAVGAVQQRWRFRRASRLDGGSLARGPGGGGAGRLDEHVAANLRPCLPQQVWRGACQGSGSVEAGSRTAPDRVRYVADQAGCGADRAV